MNALLNILNTRNATAKMLLLLHLVHDTKGTQSPSNEAQDIIGACQAGHFGSARLKFLQSGEPTQVYTLKQLDEGSVRRLTHALPNYTLARLCEQLPTRLQHTILANLPKAKHGSVTTIIKHRRHH